MKKTLLLLLPFLFLVTASSAGANNASFLNLPVDSLPVIALATKTSIDHTTLPQINKLDKLDQRTSTLLFGVVSDTHVQRANPDAQNKFQQMLGDLEQLEVPNLIINGDLGDGTPQDYHTLSTLVSRQKNTPAIFYTIGNHEFYKANHNPITNAWSPETFPNGETEVAAINRFLRFTGRDKVYYDEYLEGYHLIFLGSEKSAISDRTIGDKAFLSNTQLGWLESELQENYSPGKPIFVFLHQPLARLGSRANNFITQADRLREILMRFPEVFFFSGHIHHQLSLPSTIINEKFNMINSSSVALPRDAKGKPLPNQSEGLVVEVIDNKVFIKGRDFLTKTWVEGTQREFTSPKVI